MLPIKLFSDHKNSLQWLQKIISYDATNLEHMVKFMYLFGSFSLAQSKIIASFLLIKIYTNSHTQKIIKIIIVQQIQILSFVNFKSFDTKYQFTF